MADNLGLLLLAAGTLFYLKTPQLPTDAKLPQVPNVQREVDITRWRHDGTQPLVWYKGNGAPFADEAASRVMPHL